ncbi:MAG: LytTR family DNA-binding domain-containing protein [Selenomonadaceae bacterium]
MGINVVIVDDELPICNEIEYLLQMHPDISIMAKFEQSQSALDYIRKNECNLIFLDINMPGMTGLEFAECISAMELKVLIVFVTAYQEYALHAFSTPAVGYITKPITQSKLTKALAKVRTLLKNTEAPFTAARVSKICVKKEDGLVPVDQQDIMFAYVKTKDVFIHTKMGNYPLSLNMSELSVLLQAENFLRVHRQYIVNINYIAKIVPWFHGAYVLHIKDCESIEIPVSRAHVQELRTVLGIK